MVLLQRTTVALHLEEHLGEIDRRWSGDDGYVPPVGEGGSAAFDVARFMSAPWPGAVTFTTVGLSDHPLPSPTGRTIRHELVFAAHEGYADWAVPAILQQVGCEALAAGRPYLRGEVLGPRGPLFPGGAMEALYLMPPTILPASFDECLLPDGSGVAFCWLVPIHPCEVTRRDDYGWDEFEDRLVEAAPDLMDLERPPFLDRPDSFV